MLVRSDPRINGKFRILIFDEDYSYSFGLPDDPRQIEMIELTYQVHRAFVILAFDTAGYEKVFLSDHLCKDIERLKKRVGNLVLERNKCLGEAKDVSNSLTTMEVAMEPLRYPGTQHE